MDLLQADDRVSMSKEWFKEYNFVLIKSIDQLKKLVDTCIERGVYSIDTETTGLDNRIYPDEYFEDGKVTKYGIRTVDHIVGVCISFDGHTGYYIPLGHEPEDSGNLPWNESLEELTRLVHSKAKALMHNFRYDAEILYPLTGKEYWAVNEFEDTFLLARVINPLKSSPAGLKPLTKSHYNIDMVELDDLFTVEKREQLRREKKRYNFAMLHPKEGTEYGCSDGIFTYKLWFTLKDKIQDSELVIYNLEKSFANVLRKLERNRIHIDVDRVEQLNEECNRMLKYNGDLIRSIIESRTGKTGKWLTLNVGSVAQLSAVLLTDTEGLNLKPTKEIINEGNDYHSSNDDEDEEEDDSSSKKSQYTLKDEAMNSLNVAYGKKFIVQRITDTGDTKNDSLFDLIIEYRHYSKMRDSFLTKFLLAYDKYDDVRPQFNQFGTDTTRLSSKAGKIADGYSGVAFQGIPRDSDEDKPELFKQIRTCLIPRPGFLMVKLDFAGEELRVVTNLSGDPVWTNSFLNEDGDVHSITSRTLFGKNEVSKDERNRGKRCNFAFIYGGGAGAISRNVGCTLEEGQRHMANLRNAVPVLMGYVEHQKRFAREYKQIYTSFGRRIPIPTIDSPIKGIRAKAERCAINYTIQATSADVIKFAMCYIDKKIRENKWENDIRYVLTVHDEIVFEIKPELLQEAVRKLDEWMTIPWKLPKAHGREWVVPLTTEPGVDYHWRARFDYIKICDGTTPAKNSVDIDGNYKGKLKKNEYFSHGRIYQKIPRFLAAYLKRSDGNEAEIDETDYSTKKSTDLPVVTTLKVNQSEKLVVAPAIQNLAPFLSDGTAPGGIPIKILESSDKTISTVTNEPLVFNINNTIANTETKDEEQLASIGIEDTLINSKEEPINRPKITEKIMDQVFRWVLLSTPSELNMKKLHAICILAEGDVPLRIVSQKGEILINESEQILIDPSKFKFLTEMFGV